MYCPTGYIGVNSSTVRTCLRLELTTKKYDEAATSCQSDGGDLIRIDSAEKYAIFQQFITSELSENQVHNKSCYFDIRNKESFFKYYKVIFSVEA